MGNWRGGGGGSICVTPRVLTRLVCPHPGRVLLQVTLFWMSSEIAAWINSVPRSIIYFIIWLSLFSPSNWSICGP